MTHILLLLPLFVGISLACNSRNYGNGSTVCVCSKKSCDNLPPVKPLKSGQYEMYTSSKAGARFDRSSGSSSNNRSSVNQGSKITVDRHKKFQAIFGFGGAFTDAAGINILSLSNETQETLMKAYFSENGLQYSLGRIPMAGTDFSTRGYTYDDVVDDFELKHFSLQPEDLQYKIPLVKQALDLTNNELLLFGSAWTAPSWMKTNDELIGIGFLNVSMYDVWADYYMKFLESYSNHGISIWGVTTGNEPADGLTPSIHINKMAWTPNQLALWVAYNLGPKIRTDEDFSETKIMIIDDQRVFYPWVAEYILQNGVTRKYVDGLAVHYYADKYVPASVLTLTHEEFPDKFILATEGCEGTKGDPVVLGSWERAENYLSSIIDDLNNWVTGWMDWNLALSLHGGPNYVHNFVDSPIIVNKTADEFYKQPMFYAMGHFSKFVRPKSVRIESLYSGSSDLKHVTFERPDGGIVVSIFNPTEKDIPVTVEDTSNNKAQYYNVKIVKRSINSLLYW